MLKKSLKQEFQYGIYSKTYLFILLFLISLFSIISFINFHAVTDSYSDFLYTVNYYEENNLKIEEDLEKDYSFSEEGDLIENPIAYSAERVSRYIYSASPKYAGIQFLEASFSFFPIVFGMLGLSVAEFDYKYKTIKTKSVRENKGNIGLAKQISLAISSFFILISSLLISYVTNFYFYYQIVKKIPITEFNFFNIESNNNMFLGFIFAYIISIIFSIIGYTLGILFKNIYVGIVFLSIYNFIIPNLGVFDFKNSLYYIGNKIYNFYGVVDLESAAEATTLSISILILLCMLIIPFIVNIFIVTKRSSFES